MEITLRAWDINDLEALVAMANNKNIAQYMANVFPHPYTFENGKTFIEFANSKSNSVIFAIIVNGKPVGSIGLHGQADILKKNFEIGYWLAEEYWGKGIVQHAINQIVTYGFLNLDCTRIFARIFANNTASKKVIEKAGFKQEAFFEKTIFKNDQFLDELIYAIRKKGTL